MSRLIGAIPTVVAAITEPLLGDTPVVLALELGLRAELVWNRRGRHEKTRKGRAGACSIPSFERGSSQAEEETLWALTAVGLVLAVLTVVLLVTRPAHGDAASAGAGKVIERASGALHTWG